MHYHVIQKSYQNTYNGRIRWLTLWDVEVTNDRGTYTLRFDGKLCLKRGLAKLDQKIAAIEAERQAAAKARAATLKKRYTKTWWGIVDNRTGKVKPPTLKPDPETTPRPVLKPQSSESGKGGVGGGE